MELLLGDHGLLVCFPVVQNKSSFLGLLSQRRSALEGLKVVALPQPSRLCPQQGEFSQGEDQTLIFFYFV